MYLTISRSKTKLPHIQRGKKYGINCICSSFKVKVNIYQIKVFPPEVQNCKITHFCDKTAYNLSHNLSKLGKNLHKRCLYACTFFYLCPPVPRLRRLHQWFDFSDKVVPIVLKVVPMSDRIWQFGNLEQLCRANSTTKDYNRGVQIP